MCGRFALFAMPTELADLFGLGGEVETPRPRYNIAPTQDMPIVRARPDEGRQLVLARWGLIPGWAKDPAIGNRMINARAESVAEKPAFRAAFKSRRCLIPASGFYEWAKHGARKQPYFVGLKSREPFAFAGLWERWSRPEGGPIESCTILTTSANDVMRPIHERMPVILDPADYATWLGEARAGPDELRALLGPCPAEPMDAYPVSTYVSDPSHDDERCIGRAEPPKQKAP